MHWLKLLVMAMAVLWPAAVVAAPPDGFIFSTSSRLKIASEAAVNVDQTVQVTNKNTRILKTLELKLPFNKIEKLRVSYQDGREIPFKTEIQTARLSEREFTHTNLQLDLPRRFSGRGNSWQIHLNYTAPEAVRQFGEGATLLLPFTDAGLGGSWQAEVTAPKSLPAVNYHPTVTNVTVLPQNRVFSFGSRDVKRPLIGLSFLGNQSSELQFNQRVRGHGLWRSRQTVVIPPELHQQRVYLKNISPKPDGLDVDADGNVLALYRLWPWQQLSVRVTTQVAVKQLRYDPRKATAKAALTPELATLTRATSFWPSDNAAREATSAITQDQQNLWVKAQALNRFVATSVSLRPSAGRRLPQAVLANKTANALEMSDLLISLLRSQKIPARQIIGVVPPSSGLYDQQMLHAWAEAYVSGVGWVTLDPVWSQLFDSFGYSSSDRLAMAVLSGGEAAGHSAAELLASYTNIDINPTTAGLSKPAADSLLLSATRYALLPFVGSETITIANNDGYVADNISLNGQSLGSLAPQEIVSQRQFNFGWPQASRLTLYKNEVAVAKAAAQPVWWPAAGFTLSLGFLGMIQFYRWRIRRHRGRLVIKVNHE